MTEWVTLTRQGKGWLWVYFSVLRFFDEQLVKPNFVNCYYASSHDDGEALGTWDHSISTEYT